MGIGVGVVEQARCADSRAADLAQELAIEVLGANDGTDPAPADVAGESDLLTGKQVRALLYNSQVTSPITSQMHDLAVANGIPVVGVAETIPAAYATFVEWQIAQLNQLEQALASGG